MARTQARATELKPSSSEPLPSESLSSEQLATRCDRCGSAFQEGQRPSPARPKLRLISTRCPNCGTENSRLALIRADAKRFSLTVAICVLAWTITAIALELSLSTSLSVGLLITIASMVFGSLLCDASLKDQDLPPPPKEDVS